MTDEKRNKRRFDREAMQAGDSCCGKERIRHPYELEQAVLITDAPALREIQIGA